MSLYFCNAPFAVKIKWQGCLLQIPPASQMHILNGTFKTIINFSLVLSIDIAKWDPKYTIQIGLDFNWFILLANICLAKHLIKFENYVWFKLNNCQIQTNLWPLDKSGQIFFYLTSCKIYDGWNHSLRNTNILLQALPSVHLPSIWQVLWSAWCLLSNYLSMTKR